MTSVGEETDAADRSTIRRRAVAILIYDNVEVLDFAAPFEVFSVAGRRDSRDLFDVFTVAPAPGIVRARNELCVEPTYTLPECPRPDLLVVPGGFGSRVQMGNAELVDWIARAATTADVVMGICTGSLLLAVAGLLRGRRAATHHGARTALSLADRSITVVNDRIVDEGRVVTSGGISAGLDASFHVLARLTDEATAAECAEYMEYRRHPGDAVTTR